MLNKKLQKDKIREILKNNKGLATKNKSIVGDDYLEYKKLRKSVNKRLDKNPETRTVARYNGLQEFLEEAYKHFLMEAEEMINKETLEAKKDISEKVSDNTIKVTKPKEEKSNIKDTTKKGKTKETVSKKTKSVVKPENLSTVSNNKENEDTTLNKKEETIKALKHPDSKITETSKELKNPFNESNKSSSNMQIGFFGGTQEDSKKGKSKSKSTKKKSKSTSTDSMSTNLQMSFLI